MENNIDGLPLDKELEKLEKIWAHDGTLQGIAEAAIVAQDAGKLYSQRIDGYFVDIVSTGVYRDIARRVIDSLKEEGLLVTENQNGIR